ncbi:MAG TPA: hypothetical protein DEA64_02950 [Pseudothermotoga sp.]|nr:hypothetical protein [Pseudothermotoga sp.]
MKRFLSLFIIVSILLALASGCVAPSGSSPNLVGRWESTSTFPVDEDYDGRPDLYGKYVLIVENQKGSTFTGQFGGIVPNSGISLFFSITGTITSGGSIVITVKIPDITTDQTITVSIQGVYASGRITLIGDDQTIELVKVQ